MNAFLYLFILKLKCTGGARLCSSILTNHHHARVDRAAPRQFYLSLSRLRSTFQLYAEVCTFNFQCNVFTNIKGLREAGMQGCLLLLQETCVLPALWAAILRLVLLVQST